MLLANIDPGKDVSMVLTSNSAFEKFFFSNAHPTLIQVYL